jgi:hypothetical protein
MVPLPSCHCHPLTHQHTLYTHTLRFVVFFYIFHNHFHRPYLAPYLHCHIQIWTILTASISSIEWHHYHPATATPPPAAPSPRRAPSPSSFSRPPTTPRGPPRCSSASAPTGPRSKCRRTSRWSTGTSWVAVAAGVAVAGWGWCRWIEEISAVRTV